MADTVLLGSSRTLMRQLKLRQTRFMSEALSITEARPILGDLARRVAATREPLILTDHGRPIATLMPLSPEQGQEKITRATRRPCPGQD